MDILRWWFNISWGEPNLRCPYAWIGPFLFTWVPPYYGYKGRIYWPRELNVSFYPTPD